MIIKCVSMAKIPIENLPFFWPEESEDGAWGHQETGVTEKRGNLNSTI